MHDRELKVRCLEAIDRHVLGPIVEYLRARPEEVGGLVVVPDHYTNLLLGPMRVDAHSLHPVPFVIWNGRDCDGVTRFDETSVLQGWYGENPVNHLDLLPLLGMVGRGARLSARYRRRRSGEISSAPGLIAQTPG
jgi:2,3-bisphosphoglycerate-independent phosphoglycerate mutase